MNTIKSLRKELEWFGLTQNQAEIYLFLIQQGELRIQEIANLSKIPRTSVYESLKKLEKVGLIEKIVDHKFNKIRPYPIHLLRHRLDEKIVFFQKQAKKLDELTESFQTLSTSQALSSASVRYYKNISGARQIFWNSLNAQNTVHVYTEYRRPNFVGRKFYADFSHESKMRHIKEKVLINLTPQVIELLNTFVGQPGTRTNPKDVRTIDETKILIKGETLIYDNIYAQVYIYTDQINGFEIENTQFVETQRSIFETLWNAAHPLLEVWSKP